MGDPAPIPQPPLCQMAIAERFAGRRALVTGAGSGIGAATARQLVAEGAHVTGVDPDAEGLEQTARGLGEDAERFRPLIADVAEATAQEEMIAAACGPEGELDVLVNNAAVFMLAGLEATEEQWRRSAEVNLIAPAQLVAKAADALGQAKAGAVVNVASISGHVSQPDRWTYSAGKGGILALTRCQALDLAPRGVRVNSVSPGYVWTKVLYEGADWDRERWEPIWGEYCPLGRCAEPSEVAAAIAFLCSEAASFITGSDLPVDGGLAGMGPDAKTAHRFD